MNIENQSETTLRLMDEVVATICANILTEHAREKEIELVNFDPNKPAHKLYLVQAENMAALLNCKIGLDLKPLKYVWFKIKRLRYNSWKNFYRVKHFSDAHPPIDTILDFVAEYHQIGYDFYEAIYDAYYKVK